MSFLLRLNKGIKRLGPVNKTVFYITVIGLILALIFALLDFLYFNLSVDIATFRNESKKRERVDLLNNLPITELTIGLDTTGTETISTMMQKIELPTLELSIDRGPYIYITT